MRPNYYMIMAGVCVTSSVLCAATPSTRMPSEYDVLTRKSIFSNQPGRPTAERRSEEGSRSRRAALLPVLVGIARDEENADKYVAVIEDPDSGRVYRIPEGGALPQNGNVITQLTLDYILVKSATDTQSRKLLIGQNINGGAFIFPDQSAAPVEGVAGDASVSGASSTASPSSDGAASGSIEERMRARRRQQGGK